MFDYTEHPAANPTVVEVLKENTARDADDADMAVILDGCTEMIQQWLNGTNIVCIVLLSTAIYPASASRDAAYPYSEYCRMHAVASLIDRQFASL